MEVLASILLSEKNARKLKEESLNQREQIISDHKQKAQNDANELFIKTNTEIIKLKENNKMELEKLFLKHEKNMKEIETKILIATKNKKNACFEMIISKVVGL